MKVTVSEPASQALLTTFELAKLLNLSVRTIQSLRQRGQLPPPVRLGTRSVRWRRADVDRWLAQLP